MYTYGQRKKSKAKVILSILILLLAFFIFFKDEILENPKFSDSGIMPVSDDSLITDIDFKDEKFKKQIQEIVKETLHQNPELIISSVENYQKDQQKRMMDDSKESIKKFSKQIQDAHSFPSIGNKNSKVILTQFFDYNCSFCHKAAEGIKELHEKDKDVLIIFRDLPILGQTSDEISKIALSVYKLKPSEYFNFYMSIITLPARSPEVAKHKALEYGINKDELEHMIHSKDIAEIINKNKELAKNIKVFGTPYIIINNELLNVMPTYDELAKKVKEARG